MYQAVGTPEAWVLGFIKIWFELTEKDALEGFRVGWEGTDKTEVMARISWINQLGPKKLKF